jgi:squalene-hopene/tetraprenyl-beta-curcumene cyclase
MSTRACFFPFLLSAACAASRPTFGGEPVTLANVEAPPPISPDEPMAKEFSLARAARYLDTAALSWQKEKKCGTCHTNFAYLMSRPALSGISPPSLEVRAFFEEMVEKRWEKEGPRWDAEVVCAATTLAWNDRTTRSDLHPLTRKAFDRMLKLQREDGGWSWLKCGWPPMESDDHYGATFAALGIGLAPQDYAKTDAAQKCLEGIRRYLTANPPPSLHHQAMVLWASLQVDGLMKEEERKRTLDELFSLQHDDGGWSIASLIQGWKDHRRQDDEAQDTKTSDGYATGFVVYLARQAGISASDPRLEKGIRWLKGNQRESGRWFTRSPTKNSKHYISNAGTAFAVLAIKACDEAAGPRATDKSQPPNRDSQK